MAHSFDMTIWQNVLRVAGSCWNEKRNPSRIPILGADCTDTGCNGSSHSADAVFISPAPNYTRTAYPRRLEIKQVISIASSSFAND